MKDLERAAQSLADALAAGIRRMAQHFLLGTLLVAILMAAVALYVILNAFTHILANITGSF